MDASRGELDEKILLVDDEPKILASLRRGLGDRFSLVCAESAAEALALVERDGPFAAVVSDVRMPGMGGIDLLRELRRRAPGTVRLVLSGHADFDAVIAAINDGAVFRFHTKPVAPEVLAASLECALLRHQEQKHAAARIDPQATLVREVAEIRRALTEGQFRLYLQPQVHVATGGVAGAEALVRWAHPERGLLGPGEFLATVEAAGLMAELTVVMLEAACQEARRWQDGGRTDLKIAVNATSLDFCRPDFAGQVLRIVDRHGIAAGMLELELTEGVAVADPQGTRAVVEDLARLGIPTSIDDFGSGYSALGWLRRLPVAKLKIDRIFIEDVATDPAAYRVLEAIVALARDLHMAVLAEGVETDAQLAMVRRAGCEMVQGYLVSQPMPAEAFMPWLTARRRGEGA